MRRAPALLLAALCALATPARAQDRAAPRRPSALVHYGKWAALGLAAGFTYLGATTHDRADRDYGDLLAYCRDSGPCPIGADGRYTNATAEDLYIRVRDGDRKARAWLIGGQVALLTGAAFFIVELKHGREPRNIPFAPYVAAGRLRTRIGLQVGLPR